MANPAFAHILAISCSYLEPVVRFGVETAIAAGLMRELVEGSDVDLQAGYSLVFIAGIVVQDAVVAHQSTFDFVEPDLMSICPYSTGRVPGSAHYSPDVPRERKVWLYGPPITTVQ